MSYFFIHFLMQVLPCAIRSRVLDLSARYKFMVLRSKTGMERIWYTYVVSVVSGPGTVALVGGELSSFVADHGLKLGDRVRVVFYSCGFFCVYAYRKEDRHINRNGNLTGMHS